MQSCFANVPKYPIKLCGSEPRTMQATSKSFASCKNNPCQMLRYSFVFYFMTRKEGFKQSMQAKQSGVAEDRWNDTFAQYLELECPFQGEKDSVNPPVFCRWCCNILVICPFHTKKTVLTSCAQMHTQHFLSCQFSSFAGERAPAVRTVQQKTKQTAKRSSACPKHFFF